MPHNAEGVMPHNAEGVMPHNAEGVMPHNAMDVVQFELSVRRRMSRAESNTKNYYIFSCI
jgi:hypothetical protein